MRIVGRRMEEEKEVEEKRLKKWKAEVGGFVLVGVLAMHDWGRW